MTQGIANTQRPPTKAESRDLALEDALWQDFFASRDPVVRSRLVDFYYDHATSIARSIFSQRAWTGVHYEDCLQLALEGLISAIDRFQGSRGASFKTYSRYRIKGSVLNGLDQYSEEYDYAAYKRRLAADRTSSIASSNSSAESKKEKSALERVADITVELALSHLLSEPLDEIVDDSPYGNPGRVVLQKQLFGFVEKLPDKQRDIIKSYYFEGVAFADIAESLSLSKARVSQLHGLAIKRIHQYCVSRELIKS